MLRTHLKIKVGDQVEKGGVGDASLALKEPAFDEPMQLAAVGFKVNHKVTKAGVETAIEVE